MGKARRAGTSLGQAARGTRSGNQYRGALKNWRSIVAQGQTAIEASLGYTWHQGDVSNLFADYANGDVKAISEMNMLNARLRDRNFAAALTGGRPTPMPSDDRIKDAFTRLSQANAGTKQHWKGGRGPAGQ